MTQEARAPSPPTAPEERRLAQLLRWGFAEDLHAQPQDAPPAEWGGVAFGVPRKNGGLLAAILFPHDEPRGVVLLGHPEVPAGKGYFHQNNRVPFARNLGLAVVTFDHGGFGESDGPTGLYHSEWEDVIGWARRRFPDLPVHVWGVGLGGYFAHHALARDPGVASVVFEEVPPDLARALPSRLARLVARLVARQSVPWWPALAHAPHLHAERLLYAYGDRDPELPVAQAERLWRAAGPFAQRHVVEGAGRLETWKAGGEPLREAIRKTMGL